MSEELLSNILGLNANSFNLPDTPGSPSAPGSPDIYGNSFAEALGQASSDKGDADQQSFAASPREVVFSTANANQDLIEKINNAQTVDERLGYVDQLRDIIVSALNSSGHDAYSYGKHDKIVINDVLYDIFYASNGVGMDTRIQMLDHGPAHLHGIYPPGSNGGGGTDSGTNLVAAIFNAGSSALNLISQISSSTDLQERRQLGGQFIDHMVQTLNGKGYSAEAHGDPDKIVINGTTFDVIRSLNSPGRQANLQALMV